MKSGRISTLVTIVFVAFTVGSCATVKHGTLQPVSVKSDPPDATIKLNGDVLGKTPTTLNLSRTKRSVGTMTLERDGYHPKTISITRQMSGAFWGNLLLGGIIGMIVDWSNGAWANLTPISVDETLLPVEPAVAAVSPLETSTGKAEATSQNTPQLVERLKQLKDANEAGLISDSEYNVRRKEIVKEF